MGNVLSVEEVDSLLAEAKKASSGDKKKSPRIPKRTLRYLEDLQRNISVSLSQDLREFYGLDTEVALFSSESMELGDFLNSLSTEAPFFSFGIPGTDGKLYLGFEPEFRTLLVEALAGGAGLNFPSRTSVGTRFEGTLCEMTAERMRREIGRILGRFGCEYRILFPDRIDSVRSVSYPLNTPCFFALYEIKIGGKSALFSLCVTERGIRSLVPRIRRKLFPYSLPRNLRFAESFPQHNRTSFPSERDGDRVVDVEARISRAFESLLSEGSGCDFADEHPQTIALLLAIAPGEAAPKLLERLTPDLRIESAARLSKIRDVSPDIVLALLSSVEADGARKRLEGKFEDGTEKLYKTLLTAEADTAKSILEGIHELDGVLAAKLRNKLFVFDDLLILDEGSVGMILEHADKMDLRMAMRDTSCALQEHIYRSLPDDLAEELRDDMAYSGPVRLSLVLEAQRRISNIALKLKVEGKISIPPRGSDASQER